MPPAVPVSDPPELTSFDYYGNDSATSMHYCTNVRLAWIYPGQAMRADVRVWWRRRAGASAPAADAQLSNCAAGMTPASLTADPRVRMVYTSTVLRYHPRVGS